MRTAVIVMLLSLLIPVSGTIAADDVEKPAGIHLPFDAEFAPDAQVRIDGARIRESHAGPLIKPAHRVNAGSIEFDGKTGIAYVTLEQTEPAMTDSFTWEGFFLSPANNKYESDGAIADRFVSQYVDATGSSTRLTIGLSAVKAKGPAYLCLSFAGSGNRHNGKTPVDPDIWHHFAVVHDSQASPPTLTWYLDYEQEGEVSLDHKSSRTTLQPPGTAPFTLGARLKTQGKVDRGFAGSLDEIRLSEAALKPVDFVRVEEPVYERHIVAQLYSDLPDAFDWNLGSHTVTEELKLEAVALAGLPRAYSARGYDTDRRGRHAVQIQHRMALPKGSYHFLMRAESNAVLTVDSQPLIDARVQIPHHPLGELPRQPRDYIATWISDGEPKEFALIASELVDSDRELGDVIVAHRRDGAENWFLLGHANENALSSAGWAGYRGRMQRYFRSIDHERRAAAIGRGDHEWVVRHESARQSAQSWRVEMTSKGLHPIDAWFESQIDPAVHLTEIDDAAFLRRLSLDVLGRIPTRDELTRFLEDVRPNRRVRAIDRLLASSEWADSWVGYWQDVLAENPSILKPTLNNSGPFRQWIYDSIQRNLPLDRFATELISMEGEADEGGTAGFAIASQNDAPMAMKAHVVMKAFLAVDLQCARCHDAPNAFWEQRDLFSLAAMLNDGPIALPATSIISVPADGRQPLVSTSLKAGQKMHPEWTLNDLIEESPAGSSANDFSNSRERLAALITSPENPRFSDVMVNRVWKRFLGQGLVNPVDDWPAESAVASDGLLRQLSGWFVESGYDLRALARLILTSRVYQSAVVVTSETEADHSLAGLPVRRRLSAEQIVDSLYISVGKGFDAEEQTFDPNKTRGFLNLGTPRRAWQFTSLSNERDRPALSMPVNQSIIDVLTTFGWRETRPDPLTDRDHSPNPLQPLMIENGLMVSRAVRLTENSWLTELAVQDISVDELVDNLFLAVLSRTADSDEREAFVDLLTPDFAERRTGLPKPPEKKQQRARVDWDKHLKAEASLELLEAERLVREGDPPTVRLTVAFRERVEDAVWALLNSPEFVFVP